MREMHAAPEQGTGGTPLSRIDSGLREHTTTQQRRNLLRVDCVVFGRAAMHLLAQLERAREALALGRLRHTLTLHPGAQQAVQGRFYCADNRLSAAFEVFLTQLYVDAPVRRRFLADPLAETTRAGLTTPEVQALQHIDRVGLELAARSFAYKRQQVQRAHVRGLFPWSK